MDPEFAQLQTRCTRLEQLHRVSQVLHSTLEPEKALDLILREAVRLTGAKSGSVVLLNPTTGFLEIQAAHQLPPEARRLRLRVGEGITGWVARTGEPARVGEVQKDARYIRVRNEVRSELAVPVEVHGERRGVINVDADRVNAFSAVDQELLSELARQASKAIENTWRYEQLRRKERLFENLICVSQSVHATLSLDEALQAITREACLLMGAKLCSLLLLDASGEWLELRACHGAGPAYRSRPRLALADCLLGTVVRRQKPLQVENVQSSARYQRVNTARAEGLISLLSVPLLYRGESIGTLSVYTGMPRRFSDDEVRTLSTLAEFSAVAIEKARLYERVVDVEDQLRRSEKLSALGLLAAETAHEIRNPLTVMKMLFHSLDLHFDAQDPRSRDVQIMGEKMDHLNRIVDRMLDFARQPEPAFSTVDVNRLLQDLALLTRHKLRQQNIRLVFDLAPQLPRVTADATQLEQAFLNLTLNATEAMHEGGTLTLATRALQLSRHAPVPTHVAVLFRDTGPGMTADQQARAFGSPFHAQKPKGTGLGLAIVARIVQAHEGKIRISSRPGHGTTVRLILPLGGGP